MDGARRRGQRARLAAAVAVAVALWSGAAGAQTAAPSTPDEQLATGRTLLATGIPVAIGSALPLAGGFANLGCSGDDCRSYAGALLGLGGGALAIGLGVTVGGIVVRHRALARGAAGRPMERYPTLIRPGITMIVVGGLAAIFSADAVLLRCGILPNSDCSRDSTVAIASAIAAVGVTLAASGIVLLVLGKRGDRVPGPRLPALGFRVPGVGAPGASLGWRF